jgi:hypothetical protein
MPASTTAAIGGRVSSYHLARRLEADALRGAAAALVRLAEVIETQLILADERQAAVHTYESIGALPRGVKAPADLGRKATAKTIERCGKCGQIRIGPAWRFHRDGAWHRDAGTCPGALNE